ncbi:universal stress protein [Neptuniibacter sp. SY11_33]|uniref:universal stress protein n=1 Tax=Neptuniibacter sp. SY11_33 TaxID=3398215 RepID=UPI0039F5163C
MDRLLVNIDFKHDNSSLIEKAVNLAEQHSAFLELFSCCYNRSLKHSHMFDAKQELKAEHAYVKQTEAKLEELCLNIEALGIKTGFDASWNRHTGEGIVRKVLRFQPDLVLHSIQPHTRLGHYLFAPVDWQLARKCPVPVLFVKQRPWGDHTRVVTCIDPLHKGDEKGALDRELIQRTREMMDDGYSELRILHCYNTLPQEVIFDEHVVTDYEALQERVERSHFSSCDELLQEYGLSIESDMVDIIKGEADLTISNYAKHNKIDVVVMGGVARTILDRLLVGSTTEHVVDHVDCDVLIVKHPDFVCPVPES